MPKITKEVEFAGKTLSIETGVLAPQTNCSVKLQYGETVVLVTAVAGKVREDLGYFPLSVEYVEKYYAGGKISSSRFVKREAKPKDEAVLKGRLIDRSIRPLFPKTYKNETQVVITVLSVDKENDPDIIGVVGASLALALSDIPWKGPIAGVRVGKKDDQYVLNPTNDELENSPLDLVVSGTKENIVMIEAGGQEVVEADLVSALEAAQEENKKIIGFIESFVSEHGKEKLEDTVEEINTDIKENVIKFIRDGANDALFSKESAERESASEEFLEKLYVEFEGKLAKEEIKGIFEKEVKEMMRENIVEKDQRPDGRKLDEVRPITCNVSLLPRTHGSGLFQRGFTQVLSLVTLGSTSLEQLIENMDGEEKKRYMHHYNFPPYSVGEVGRFGPPPRRSIGHGSLAEKALEPVIPDKEDFPYTIRVVSECLSSAGSTSMGSVCGSTLSLMDAGVPLKKPVAGIAMGVVFKEGKYKVLTDIQALEDFYGDMDFKVAGTKDGITAIQLDVKTLDLTIEILKEALEHARVGRLFILGKMLEAIKEPRETVSKYAPKVEMITVNPKKIGEIIGPGGKMINKIIEETETEIDIDDDGSVSVTGENAEGIKRAIEIIEGIVAEVEVGKIYKGQIVKLLEFGAIVEILPGKTGMVHISEIADHRVEKIEDELSLDQEIEVKVLKVEPNGKIALTMKLNAVNNDSRREFQKPRDFKKRDFKRKDFQKR